MKYYAGAGLLIDGGGESSSYKTDPWYILSLLFTILASSFQGARADMRIDLSVRAEPVVHEITIWHIHPWRFHIEFELV